MNLKLPTTALLTRTARPDAGHTPDAGITPAPGTPAAVDETGHLPAPPTDEEKYEYFGRQHIWFIQLRSLATVCAAVSLMLFSNTSHHLWMFWIPFTIFVGYMGLTHYTTTRRRAISRIDHEFIVSTWEPDEYPSVDVFLPSAGEDLDVLDNTYANVAAMAYPLPIHVLVLDDADRPEVAALAEGYGFTYLVRPDRGHMKKAGNLKYGYEQSGGDLIVIFDADFAPRTDFLRELVPYFDTEDIAIVQSPQFFDTRGNMAWLQRGAGAVQESFYRWAQVSRNTLGAPICVGTCAIYRREALVKSGGFAQIGHSEDVHTGVNLMKVGYRTQYVPVVVAKGLCPDRMSSFISQQYRWCAGSMSLLADKEFHDAPLTYRQRMCFFTGFGYYISTAVGVYLLAVPTILMLWVYPERIQLSNFFWVLPTLLLYPIIALMHKTGWSPATLRVYTISSFSHAAAVFHTLTGHTAEWVPTGELRKTSMTSKVTMIMIAWTATLDFLMIAGVVKFVTDGRPLISVAPVMFYAVMSTYIWVPIARLAWSERAVRRASAATGVQAAQAAVLEATNGAPA